MGLSISRAVIHTYYDEEEKRYADIERVGEQWYVLFFNDAGRFVRSRYFDTFEAADKAAQKWSRNVQ